MNLPIDVDIAQIQRMKLFQKFTQQEQTAKPRVSVRHQVPPEQDDESSIYQDFANFAKQSKHGTPFKSSPYNKASCPQFQPMQQPQQDTRLIAQNSQLQQQIIDLQNHSHRQAVDLEISKNEQIAQKRVIQEQQIEIEQLKRQLQEKRNSSMDKTRQFSIVQTQLIQSNQLVEKLISQIMQQEQQLQMYRQTQFTMPNLSAFSTQDFKQQPVSGPTQPYLSQMNQIPTMPQTQQIPSIPQQLPQQPQQQQQYQQPQAQQQRQQDIDTSYERYLAHKKQAQRH